MGLSTVSLRASTLDELKSQLEEYLKPFEELVTFATLTITRYVQRIDSTSQLILDVTKLKEHDYYACGTLELIIDEMEAKNVGNSPVDLRYPVRSKIIEYLFRCNQDLYHELEEKGIIPDLAYLSIDGLNHFKDPELARKSLRAMTEEEKKLAEELINKHSLSDEVVKQVYEGAEANNIDYLEYLQAFIDAEHILK